MDGKILLGKRYEFDNTYWFEPKNYGSISIYQVGELGCDCGFQVNPHVQVCHEISYIISGEGIFYSDGVKTPVQGGDIFINTKGHIHAIKNSNKNPLRFFYLAFDFNTREKNELDFLSDIFSNHDSYYIKDNCEMLVPFNKLIDEIYGVSKYSDIMIESYIKQIFVLTYRLIYLKSRIVIPKEESNPVGYTVYSVIRYIDENIYNIQRVKCISDDLNYSYSYLSHLFKNKMGITLQNYVNGKKIEKAVSLLKEGRMSVTQISAKLNYETVQSFSKSFKKVMSVSPVQFQKSYSRQTLK